MKKRLISLLLAVAMMVAVLPTAAFAEGEANVSLHINSDGKPNVTGIVSTTDNGKKVYTGTGWSYEVHSNQDYLILDEGYSFDLTDEPAVKCYRVENHGEIKGGVFDPCNRLDSLTGVYSGYVENFGTISGGVYNGAIRFAKGNDQTSDPEIKGGIFCGDVVYGSSPNNPGDPDDTSYTTFGTISGGIFVNDPEISNKHTIHIINHGRITKLKVGSKKEVAMDTENLYIVGTLDSDLKLTLDDELVYTVSKDDVATGASTNLAKHIPLTITSDGKPDTTGMDSAFGYFCSDDWTYDSSSTPENHFPIHLLSNFSGPVGPYPVKLKVNNEGTITDGIFLNEVSGNGKITGGIFLQKPSNTDVYTIAAGEDRILTELTLGDKTVALDANTTALYVVGTPSSDLTVTVKNAYSNTYNFVIPAGSLISNLTLDNLLHIGTKELKFGADGIPNTSGTYCYYHPSTPEDKTYFGANWRYFSKSNMLYLDADNFDLGSTLITVNVNGSLTGGIIAKGATLYTLGTVKNVVVYGTLLTSSQAHIENCILLNPPEYRIGRSPSIQDCIIVNNPGNWRKTAITATDGAKITTIQLGDLTMTLDEPVSEIYFLPGDNSTPPENLTVTLDDGTEYENIDLEQTVITLAPTKRDDPTTYYTVIVEGGEARNERGDILDSEVALTAGEKITLKLLDETQGEMVFSHWDVNNNDTDLADELAKTGFDKTAHETTFAMPAHNLTLTAKYRMPEEDAPQDDSFLMTAAAVTGGAVLTGLVVWQGYNIFSQVYLNAHLPEGTAIPTNRQQLALLLWNTAGQPEASAASYVFPDVADPDVQTAARWATEQGLFKARKDGTFAPTDSVTTGQVYRAWQKVKTAG